LLIALGGPSLFVFASDLAFGRSPRLAVQVVLQLLYCTLPLLIGWIVIRHERLPLRSIGLRRPHWSTVLWGLLLWGAIALLPLISAPLLDVLGTAGVAEGIQRLVVLPMWFRVVVGLTGGIVEEVLYRGYAVERLAALTGRPWLAAAASVLVFTLAHVPAWGLGFALGADLPFAIVMTVFYLWRRDLLANILAHSSGLVVSLLTLPSP
jgi:membrane protease YdiL (CAAX protease family)